jgi:hypothetical protein
VHRSFAWNIDVKQIENIILPRLIKQEDHYAQSIPLLTFTPLRTFVDLTTSYTDNTLAQSLCRFSFTVTLTANPNLTIDNETLDLPVSEQVPGTAAQTLIDTRAAPSDTPVSFVKGL